MKFSMRLFVFVVLNVSATSRSRFGEHAFAKNVGAVLDPATVSSSSDFDVLVAMSTTLPLLSPWITHHNDSVLDALLKE